MAPRIAIALLHGIGHLTLAASARAASELGSYAACKPPTVEEISDSTFDAATATCAAAPHRAWATMCMCESARPQIPHVPMCNDRPQTRVRVPLVADGAAHALFEHFTLTAERRRGVLSPCAGSALPAACFFLLFMNAGARPHSRWRVDALLAERAPLSELCMRLASTPPPSSLWLPRMPATVEGHNTSPSAGERADGTVSDDAPKEIALRGCMVGLSVVYFPLYDQGISAAAISSNQMSLWSEQAHRWKPLPSVVTACPPPGIYHKAWSSDAEGMPSAHSDAPVAALAQTNCELGASEPVMSVADRSKAFGASLVDWCLRFMTSLTVHEGMRSPHGLTLNAQNVTPAMTDRDHRRFLLCVSGSLWNLQGRLLNEDVPRSEIDAFCGQLRRIPWHRSVTARDEAATLCKFTALYQQTPSVTLDNLAVALAVENADLALILRSAREWADHNR
jgi:hypothetical protein